MNDDIKTRAEALMLLAYSWPGEWSDGQAETYRMMLADVPSGDLLRAVSAAVKTSEFRPSVAAIRREVLDARVSFPSADEAVSQAEEWSYFRQQSQFAGGSYRPRKPEVHPLVVKAWNEVGLDVTEPQWFTRRYEALIEEWRTERLALPLDDTALDALEGAERARAVQTGDRPPIPLERSSGQASHESGPAT